MTRRADRSAVGPARPAAGASHGMLHRRDEHDPTGVGPVSEP
jgi:hypothetical protein